MANIIKPKRSETPSSVPPASGLDTYEVALNIADKKWYVKDSNGDIVEIAGAGTPGGSSGQLQYNNSGSFAGTAEFTYSSGQISIAPYGVSSGNTSELRFLELVANGSNYVGFKAPNSISTNTIWTLPNADGSSGNFLRTDGSGQLEFKFITDIRSKVKNTTGSTLNPLQVVYINGANGSTPTVALSQANAESTSSKSYGVVSETINDQAVGYVTVEGLLENINTESYTAGTALWLSPTVAGGVTTTKPSSPNHMVYIGAVVYSHKNQGSILVKIQNGFELDELHNVTITSASLADKNIIQYNGSSKAWENVAGSTSNISEGSNLYYTDTRARASVSAGTGISYNNTTGVITNSSPDQTVTLTSGTGISVTGTYPSFTITNSSPSSGGTVTSVAALTIGTTGTDLSSSVANSTTTPVITLNVPDASATNRGALTSTDWSNFNTAYANRITSLTTTGSSGSATLTSNTLNVPTYTLAGLGGIKLTDLSSTATGLTYTNTTGVFSFASGYSIPTNSSQTNWDSAYTQRLQWDGGSTNLVAATGRTSLGGTTVGSNLFTLTNPSAVTFLKVNADNTVTAESASTFRTSIGAGTGNGTVTSIATTSPITGGTITSTGTIGINASSTNTASYVVQRDASGNFSAGTITASLTGTASTATNLAGGVGGSIPYQSSAGITAMLSNGTSGQVLQSNGGSSAPSWTSIIPSGVIQMYGGSSAPTGWLLCDGTAVSRTTYASLFTAIGTNFGAGNGSTTFNLPDLRGRSPIGAGTGSGLTARTLGTNYGAETHTLSTSELPSHTHSNTVSGGSTGAMSANASHSHNVATRAGSTGGSFYRLYDRFADQSNIIATESANTDHTHTFTPSISNASAGSGGAHANLHPVLTINYIIKV